MSQFSLTKSYSAVLMGMVILSLSLASLASAHEPGESKESAAKMAGMPAPGGPVSVTTTVVIDYGREIASHPHNKIVHFPVALGCVALVFALLSLRWPEYFKSVRVLLFLAAVGAWFAVQTGRGQAREFFEGPLRPVVHTHSMLGRYTMYSLAVCFLISLMPSSRKWLWALLLLVAGLILATGFYGGILATS